MSRRLLTLVVGAGVLGTGFTVFLLAGCDLGPTAPEALSRADDYPVRLEGWVIYGAREVAPRSMWKGQYRGADAAIRHAEGDLSRVRWFVADSMRGEDRIWHARGLWLQPHTIVLAEEAVDRAGSVCHESVHDILQTRDHGHPSFGVCPIETGGGDG